MVSTLVYETRRDEPAGERMPTAAVRDAFADTLRVWGDITEDEADLGLPASREPELGFVWPVYRWARHESLGRALGGSGDAISAELSAGDTARPSGHARRGQDTRDKDGHERQRAAARPPHRSAVGSPSLGWDPAEQQPVAAPMPDPAVPAQTGG